MAEPLRIASIGAHPADIFDASGGTMAHHSARGDYVACISLTHGARIHDEVIASSLFHREEMPERPEMERIIDERSDVKAKEVRKACEIVGAHDVHLLGADDSVMLVTESAVKDLAGLLRKIRPNIVLTHFPKENDGLTFSHAIAGQITKLAIDFAASIEPGDRNPPIRVSQIYFYGTGAASARRNVWDSQGGYYNDIFIDIEDVIDKKLAALDCLVSQGYAGAYARKRIETTDGAFGVAGHCAYAEGFIAQNAETHYYLPVTEHALAAANMNDMENVERISHRIKVD
jgi:LmbE family N-acetylglucosaminyl deacetylase